MLASAAFGLAPLCASARTTASAQDVSFARMAAQGGMAEVADATLAQTNGTSPQVKSFAAKMLVDHGKANKQLTAIAKTEQISLPSDIGPVNTKMKGTLESLKGTTFDSAYLQQQRQSHVQTAALFKKEIANGKDAKLVAFAKTVLPTVMQHLALDRQDLSAMGSKMAPGTGSKM